MPLEPKISANDYYETLPAATHSTGDIWRDLPAFGLLGKSTATGLVITPACDLAQRKCETITYLPVVKLSEYIGSSALYSETWRSSQEILVQLKLERLVMPPDRFELPNQKEIEGSLSKANLLPKLNDQKKLVLKRLEGYCEYIRCIHEKNNPSPCLVELIVSRVRFEKILSGIVTNNFKPDIHFLPAATMQNSYSAIPESSLALFRYPLTVPISMLNQAQLSDEDNWACARDALGEQFPISKHFSSWPVKLGRLRNDFLSDLLSRYLGMYIRMGSREFTEGDVASFVKNIKDSK